MCYLLSLPPFRLLLITAKAAKAENALCNSKKTAQENWKQGLEGTRYSGPWSALQKRAVLSSMTLALPSHTFQPLFLQDVTAFPGQINALCQTAGKHAIKKAAVLMNQSRPEKINEAILNKSFT